MVRGGWYPDGMNILDILIAVVVAACAVYGLWKGFVRIAIGVAGFALSLAVALRMADRGPVWFAEVFQSAQLARACAFALVLAAGLVLTGVAGFLARKLVASAHIGWLDRLVGTTVGVVGACLVICGLLVGLTAFLPPGSALLGQSVLVPYAMSVSDLAAKILPPDIAREYRQRRSALDKYRLGPASEPVERSSRQGAPPPA